MGEFFAEILIDNSCAHSNRLKFEGSGQKTWGAIKEGLGDWGARDKGRKGNRVFKLLILLMLGEHFNARLIANG